MYIDNDIDKVVFSTVLSVLEDTEKATAPDKLPSHDWQKSLIQNAIKLRAIADFSFKIHQGEFIAVGLLVAVAILLESTAQTEFADGHISRMSELTRVMRYVGEIVDKAEAEAEAEEIPF